MHGSLRECEGERLRYFYVGLLYKLLKGLVSCWRWGVNTAILVVIMPGRVSKQAFSKKRNYFWLQLWC